MKPSCTHAGSVEGVVDTTMIDGVLSFKRVFHHCTRCDTEFSVQELVDLVREANALCANTTVTRIVDMDKMHKFQERAAKALGWDA